MLCMSPRFSVMLNSKLRSFSFFVLKLWMDFDLNLFFHHGPISVVSMIFHSVLHALLFSDCALERASIVLSQRHFSPSKDIKPLHT